MGKGKKGKYQDYYASAETNDYYGTLFVGMCKHPNYKALKIGAKQFYSICRVQARSTLGTSCLYQHANEFGRNYGTNCFVFPETHQRMYGYSKGNASKYLKQLEAAGFIEKIEDNHHIKKVNVYAFSDEWKNSS